MFQGGKTPLLPVARLEALGYNIVIIPKNIVEKTKTFAAATAEGHAQRSESDQGQTPVVARAAARRSASSDASGCGLSPKV